MSTKQIECKRCGSCCTQYPCNLLPSDIIPLADYLKLTIKEVIYQYLIIDYYADQNGDLYFLVPKREGDRPGNMFASFSWAFQMDNPCVFLQETPRERTLTTCRINPVKPHGGQHMECWDKKHLGKKWFGDAWESELGVKYLTIARGV